MPTPDERAGLGVAPATRLAMDVAGRAVDYDSSDAVAKVVTDAATGRQRHFVKIHNSGANAGRFCHANSMYPDGTRSRAVPSFVWISVSAACFDSYARYLSTGNQNLLREAERQSCQN